MAGLLSHYHSFNEFCGKKCCRCLQEPHIKKLKELRQRGLLGANFSSPSAVFVSVLDSVTKSKTWIAEKSTKAAFRLARANAAQVRALKQGNIGSPVLPHHSPLDVTLDYRAKTGVAGAGTDSEIAAKAGLRASRFPILGSVLISRAPTQVEK